MFASVFIILIFKNPINTSYIELSNPESMLDHDNTWWTIKLVPVSVEIIFRKPGVDMFCVCVSACRCVGVFVLQYNL